VDVHIVATLVTGTINYVNGNEIFQHLFNVG